MNSLENFLQSLIFDWAVFICFVAAPLMMFLGFMIPASYKMIRYRLITYGARLGAILFLSLGIMAKAYWQVALAIALGIGIILLQRKYYSPKDDQKQ